MDQNYINIAMVTGNVCPLAHFLLDVFKQNGLFCLKLKKCNNFSLYRLHCTSLFSFCILEYMTRYLFKFIWFLTKCVKKDNIMSFTKAAHNKIFNVGEYMRKKKLGCWKLKRTKSKLYSSGA